jgi:hypothetical protein
MYLISLCQLSWMLGRLIVGFHVNYEAYRRKVHPNSMLESWTANAAVEAIEVWLLLLRMLRWNHSATGCGSVWSYLSVGFLLENLFSGKGSAPHNEPRDYYYRRSIPRRQEVKAVHDDGDMQITHHWWEHTWGVCCACGTSSRAVVNGKLFRFVKCWHPSLNSALAFTCITSSPLVIICCVDCSESDHT